VVDTTQLVRCRQCNKVLPEEPMIIEMLVWVVTAQTVLGVMCDVTQQSNGINICTVSIGCDKAVQNCIT